MLPDKELKLENNRDQTEAGDGNILMPYILGTNQPRLRKPENALASARKARFDITTIIGNLSGRLHPHHENSTLILNGFMYILLKAIVQATNIHSQPPCLPIFEAGSVLKALRLPSGRRRPRKKKILRRNELVWEKSSISMTFKPANLYRISKGH